MRITHARSACAALLVSTALLVLAAPACTTPIVVESAEAACRNGLDDDANGKTDCEDPACADSGACETTLASCRNELDDNRDGKTDCEDPACAKFCESFATACDTVLPSGDGAFPRVNVSAGTREPFASRRTGSAQCPVGMFCYPKAGSFTGGLCSLPGPKRIGASCTNPTECAGDSGCPGICSAVCRNDAGCPQATYCARRDGETGFCTMPCIPDLGNSSCAGFSCLTLHQFQIRFQASASLAVCTNAPPWAGTAVSGAACANPPARDKLDRMCAPGLVCVPDSPAASTGVCRTTCAFDVQRKPLFACTGGATCVLAFPADQREVLAGTLIPGICVP